MMTLSHLGRRLLPAVHLTRADELGTLLHMEGALAFIFKSQATGQRNREGYVPAFKDTSQTLHTPYLLTSH